MKLNRIALFACGVAMIMSSCTPTKEITYFQEINPGWETPVTAHKAIQLIPNDKLTILVTTADPRLNMLFNQPVAINRIGNNVSLSSGAGTSSTSTNGDIAPYIVDSQGDIMFPVLGKIHVAGMTREGVAEYIRRELISRDLAKDPIVTVDFLNLAVSVMGEVARPGRYGIDREDYTILDALSASGDLTIYGVRDNVKVIRTEKGVQKVYEVNLNSGKDLSESPVYYMQQNDVIYVEPNGTKKRTSTPNGNSWSTPGLWISLVSAALTATTLIVSLTK